MTDIIARQLVEASFKGVTFRVRDELQTEGGRRVILHEYPNSNQRFVEDLGELPPIFVVHAFVHGSGFLDSANALEQVLNSVGSGKLTLPTFGTVEAYALPWSKRASQISVGEIEYTLEFALGRPTPGPVTRERQIEDLYELGDTARGHVQLALDILYSPPGTALNTAIMQYDILQTAQTLFNQYSTAFTTNRLNTFTALITDSQRNRGTLVRVAANLSANFIQGTPSDLGLWQQVSEGVTGGLDIALRGINFGHDLSIQSSDIIGADENSITLGDLNINPFTSDISLWPETTEERILRNSNRRVFVQSYRVSSLIIAYEQAAASDFATEQQVIDTREQLNQAYDVVMRGGINGVESIQLRPDVRDAVNDVRFTALGILERKAQSSPGLTTIRVNAPISQLALTYALYSEEITTTSDLETRAEQMRVLNPSVSGLSLNGELTIFDREGL